MIRFLRTRWLLTVYLGRGLGALGFERPVAIKICHPHLLDGARHLPDSVHGGARHPVSMPGRGWDVGTRRLRSLRSVS